MNQAQLDLRETRNKIRQFGGKYHPRQRGTQEQKEALALKKCDELGIAPVYKGQF